MTYREIAKKFRNKWVLLHVTKERRGQVVEGEILLSGDRRTVDGGLVKAGRGFKNLAMLYFGTYKKRGWAAAYYADVKI